MRFILLALLTFTGVSQASEDVVEMKDGKPVPSQPRKGTTVYNHPDLVKGFLEKLTREEFKTAEGEIIERECRQDVVGQLLLILADGHKITRLHTWNFRRHNEGYWGDYEDHLVEIYVQYNRGTYPDHIRFECPREGI